MMLICSRNRLAISAALILAGCATQVSERITMPTESNALWRSECGSCHAIFPPKMLTASNWQAVMRGLDRHFGVDASLDDKSRDEISAFLVRQAAPDVNDAHSAPSLRITDTEYFLRAHSGSSVATWRSSGKDKPSNCVACHKSRDELLW